MANTKISELVTADTLISNTLLVIVDRSTGTPITKKVELGVLDTYLDITVDKANGAYNHANAAFNTANVGTTIFNQANIAFDHANAGFNFANTANIHANQAFHRANSAYESQNVTGTYANNAYLHANSGFIHANSGYDFANTANIHANQAFHQANAGFLKANAAFTLANINYISAETRLNVSNTVSGYRFDQYVADNPVVHANPGTTIALDLQYIPYHSIAIRDTVGGTNVTTGLVHISSTGTLTLNDEAQGKNSGILFWKIPSSDANRDYFYQSLVDPLIYGTIKIEQRPSVIQNVSNSNANTISVAYLHANAAFNVANTGVAYSSPDPSVWNTSAPVDVANAISRLANAVYALRSNSPIP
jgi:hypothetical protein